MSCDEYFASGAKLRIFPGIYFEMMRWIISISSSEASAKTGFIEPISCWISFSMNDELSSGLDKGRFKNAPIVIICYTAGCSYW